MAAHVIPAIERALHLGALDTLSADDFAHLERCETCRGAMLLLSEALGLAPSPAFPTCDCATCRSGLAAYIDRERHDPAAAAAAAPAIWWHLWACRDCAETYRLTYLMLDAANLGELPPLPSER